MSRARGDVKARGLLHGELSRLVATLGHGDVVVIGDAGLPVPPGVPLIDLALAPDEPDVPATLRALLSELVVERGYANAEQPGIAPDAAAEIEAAWRVDASLERIDHEALKAMSGRARAVVRTGAFTPYANVVLVAGVPF